MLAVPLSLWLIVALATGLVGVVVWLWSRQRILTQTAQWQIEAQALQAEVTRSKDEATQWQQQQQQTQQELGQLRQQFQAASTQLASAQAENRQLPALQAQLQQTQAQVQQFQQRWQNSDNALAAAKQQLANWQARATEWRQLDEVYQNTRQQLNNSEVTNSRLSTQLQQEREAHQEKLVLLLAAKEELSNQFKTLANDILEEKSKRFSEQNQHSLSQLINPLHERIQGFSQLVQNTYEKEAKERTTLEVELKRLQELNTQLHGDAKALTDALTGTQNKNQGNWGEMILEKVLESSGLQKGREYIVQAATTITDEHGQQRRLQPDVLVNLPDNKQIIIDAKVSLTAYVRYTQAADAQAAARELAAHVHSVRQHIKELAAKRYDNIDGINTLDFVFMFIPVEPAYLLALQHDNQLFDDCFAKRIMLVGPSTLLATLRTVANIWRNEQQNQNALTIAQEGGKLYDKFVGFVATLEGVGKNIEQAQTQYQTAMKQLHTGRGNLINRAKKLSQLGVPTSKTLPAAYQTADDEDDTSPALPATTE